ncbi:MauE/DoxX family redox-associated membrane protein [Corynebacterium sp. H127]|uniref:MauE/DoxX family redox-associated membrane protein n=1 Tax=Corynebacterium sp. H127 TaxID=3133418 RepID=UPI0030A4E4DA
MTVTSTVDHQPNSRRLGISLISAVSRFGLALVWLISGFQKMSDPLAFRQSVQAYELFPSEMVSLISTVLPPIELALGLLLLLGLFIVPAAAITALFMVCFIFGLASAAARGLEINCGCFSAGEASSSSSLWLAILRDLLFLAMAGWAIKFPFTKFALHP